MTDPKTPATRPGADAPATPRSGASEVEAFVRHARALAVGAKKGEGRLILALDATMSRQPTWDLACRLQAEMFDAVGKQGGLSIQLVYFRGFDECRSSKFVTDTASLRDLMAGIECRGGHTQIGRVLSHALKENARQKVSALVFIGDAMEEDADELSAKAGELGLRGLPLFLFQEGHDTAVEKAFKEFARLSKGAWFRFDRSAAATLAKLLSAVALYATGGVKALEARGRAEDRLMIEHLGGKAR
jgi:hypothetical protein